VRRSILSDRGLLPGWAALLQAAGVLALLLGPLLVSPGAAHAAPAEPTLKPLLTGLLDRSGPPPVALQDVVRSYVVQVSWKDLQPSPASLSTSVLDRRLADARERGARVKLRILAGVESPDWAKRLDGRPVSLRDPHDDRSGSVPRFWTPAFSAAYADLHARLAARYDADPVVAEVVVSQCSTFYAEPFVRQTSERRSRLALLRAGYSRAADQECHRREVDAHRVWSRTRSGLALNPAQFVTASGGRTVDDEFTAAMMRYCEGRLGQRCVLENNSIRSPIASLDPDPRQPHYRRMYRAMARHAPAVAFQTATATRMGQCSKTLDWAARQGATYVELPWNAADAGCTPAILSDAARRLG
jgi:hypothetical protein